MPDNTVYVGRPSKWGNPYHWKEMEIEEGLSREEAKAESVRRFREYVSQMDAEHIRKELRGRNLACWCREGEPCHGGVLLEIANS